MSHSFLCDQECHLCHISDFFLLLHSAWIFPGWSVLLYTVYNCATFLTTGTKHPKMEIKKGKFVPAHHLTASKWVSYGTGKCTKFLVRGMNPGALFGFFFLVSLESKITVRSLLGVGLPLSVKPFWKHVRSLLHRWLYSQWWWQCRLTIILRHFKKSRYLMKPFFCFIVTPQKFAFFLEAFTLHIKLNSLGKFHTFVSYRTFVMALMLRFTVQFHEN